MTKKNCDNCMSSGGKTYHIRDVHCKLSSDVENLKIEKILKYIKRQNFNGAYGHLKKNMVNYINEVKEE